MGRMKEETYDAQIITDKELSPGVVLKSIRQIKEVIYESVPSYFWYALFFYFACTLISFGLFLYTEGKLGLLNFRISAEYKNLTIHEITIKETNAIVNSIHTTARLREALWWPYFMWMQIIPKLILYMNPINPKIN
jgi:hypothetical protein